jgi:cytochrome c oxidase assembly factor CtaG
MSFHPVLAIDPGELTSQLVPTAIIGLLYARRARTLLRQGRPVPALRQASFYAGLLTIVATLAALDHLAEVSLSWHMTEHLLIGDIATIMIVAGLTGPILAPILRIRLFERLRVLAHPLVALPLWALNFYAWHLPGAYQAALEQSGVHALEHLCFVAFGINMWMCLFGPLPMPRWFGNLAKLAYIVAVRLTGALLANIFLWSNSVFYPFYVHPDTARHVSPLVDQNIAGGVMMVEGSLLTLLLFCWLFMRALSESEERQELLELARSGGLELSDERAGRAVAAGRGTELRRRLEGSLHDAAAPEAIEPG